MIFPKTSPLLFKFNCLIAQATSRYLWSGLYLPKPGESFMYDWVIFMKHSSQIRMLSLGFWAQPYAQSLQMLKYFNLPTLVSNLTNTHYKITIARSAGCVAKLIKRIASTSILIKLPSAQLKSYPLSICGCSGPATNRLYKFKKLGKAGLSLRRPHVRGTAMNACDHPHGGRTSIGRPKRSAWGWIIK